MSSYMLGVDFGGGASKATLLRSDGTVICTAVLEYPTYYPNNGWAEQAPEELLSAFVGTVRSVLKNSGVNPDEIAAMAISAASQTGVYLDENDKPVRNSIYWTDNRCSAYAEQLKQLDAERIYNVCKNIPSSARTVTHLRWIRENEPENHARIARVMFVKDYIRYCLTGDFVTDYIDAMGSLLMDVDAGVWDKRLCDWAGVNENMLPKIATPDAFVGAIKPEMLKLTGLSENTRVIVGSTDTVMEVYANGAICPGQMTVKLATAGRICPITERNIPNPMLINYKHVVPGLWYPGTGTKSCAASYRWYRDVLCGAESVQAERDNVNVYKLMDEVAAKIPACSGDLYFHPYLQGELTPYFDNSLRGSFTGVASYHTKGHFNRAVLEGVAFSLKDCYTEIEKADLNIREAIIIGGGAGSVIWSQMVCDMLGIDMLKRKDADSSLGSAMLAGVAVGIFSSFADSVEKCVRTERILHPDSEAGKIYECGFKKYKQIHDALAGVYSSWQNQQMI